MALLRGCLQVLPNWSCLIHRFARSTMFSVLRRVVVHAEASAQSYGEEGEEAVDNDGGPPLMSERGSDELTVVRAQRMPSRRSSELGKRERRKRRIDDADEDDLNSLDEPIEGKKKRRGGTKALNIFITTPCPWRASHTLCC